MGLRSWVKRQAKKTKKGVDKAGKDIKHTAKKAGKEVKRTADKGVDAVEDTAKKASKEIDNLLKQAEKLGMSVIDDINKLANKAKDEVGKVANKAKDEVESFGKSTINKIEGVGKDAIDEVEKFGKDAINKIDEEVKKLPGKAEEILKTALDELAKAITKEGLKSVRGLVSSSRDAMADIAESRPELEGAVNNLSWTMQLGPMTLSYSNFYDRSEGLLQMLDNMVLHPPKLKRGEIINAIETLGPDSVDLGISINFALVIGSKELGVGGELGDIELVLFTEIADIILKEIGVPA